MLESARPPRFADMQGQAGAGAAGRNNPVQVEETVGIERLSLLLHAAVVALDAAPASASVFKEAPPSGRGRSRLDPGIHRTLVRTETLRVAHHCQPCRGWTFGVEGRSRTSRRNPCHGAGLHSAGASLPLLSEAWLLNSHTGRAGPAGNRRRPRPTRSPSSLWAQPLSPIAGSPG